MGAAGDVGRLAYSDPAATFASDSQTASGRLIVIGPLDDVNAVTVWEVDQQTHSDCLQLDRALSAQICRHDPANRTQARPIAPQNKIAGCANPVNRSRSSLVTGGLAYSVGSSLGFLFSWTRHREAFPFHLHHSHLCLPKSAHSSRR